MILNFIGLVPPQRVLRHHRCANLRRPSSMSAQRRSSARLRRREGALRGPASTALRRRRNAVVALQLTLLAVPSGQVEHGCTVGNGTHGGTAADRHRTATHRATRAAGTRISAAVGNTITVRVILRVVSVAKASVARSNTATDHDRNLGVDHLK